MGDKRWEVLHSEVLVNSPWLRLRSEACRMPGGQILDPFFVAEKSDWVNVVALTPAEELVLVRQYRHGLGRMVLEVPGGCIDPQDVSPENAARRELLEETGCVAHEWIATGVYSPNPNDQTNLVYAFLARGVEQVAGQKLDTTEELEVVRIPLMKLDEVLSGGEFLQVMHISALFFALRVLEGKPPGGVL